MKSNLKMRILMVLLAAMATASAWAYRLDGVAAQVGSDTILRSDIYNEMNRLGMQNEAYFNDIRNQMIERKLILRAASESKMTMQEWVVENRVREIINKSFGGDRNKLMETLSKQKISYPEWYARLREDLIVGAMRWNVIDKNVTSSPAALRAEYTQHPERYVSDHKVTISVIQLKPEEASKRVAISEGVKSKSFEELGGHKYENVNPDEMFSSVIVKEIAAMPKGTISHWIEADGWSYLLRKDDETIGNKLSFADAYDLIDAQVKEQEAKRLYEAWLERLRAETFIKVY